MSSSTRRLSNSSSISEIDYCHGSTNDWDGERQDTDDLQGGDSYVASAASLIGSGSRLIVIARPMLIEVQAEAVQDLPPGK